MAGEITIGAFAAVYGALNSVFTIIGEIVDTQIGSMTKNIGKIAKFLRVMDIQEKLGEEGAADFSKGVVAENISFTYPGRKKPAIKKVSISIANGESIEL